MRWLARAAHIRPDGRHDAAGVLREELRHQNVRVSQLHAKLFYQPLLESIGPTGLEISNGMTSEAAERQLAALGYEGPQTALKHMSALVNQSGRRGRVQAVLLPRLLNWLSYAPDPDAGLLSYRRLSEALAGSAGTFRRFGTSPQWPSGSCTCSVPRRTSPTCCCARPASSRITATARTAPNCSEPSPRPWPEA